jgi:hypothetical protein
MPEAHLEQGFGIGDVGSLGGKFEQLVRGAR